METRTYKNYIIELVQDECSESPRQWDMASKFVLFHKRYNLPNEIDLDESDFDSWEEMEKYIKENYQVTAIEPVYMLDHSGISISTKPFGCPWDSGQVGFAFVTADETTNKDLAEKLLQGEVKAYNSYLTGDVFGFQVCHKNGEYIDSIDSSCWGYYGDIETSGLMDDAKMFIDDYIKNQQKKHEQQLKTYLINSVPLQKRWVKG